MTARPILLVEDSPDDVELILRVLQNERTPLPIRVASDGIEALHILRGTDGHEPLPRPYLILLDINLPRMNGIELKKAIEANHELRKRAIPFVYYSTSGEKSIVDKAFELQVQGFFVKANSLEEMRKTFRVIFDYWRISRHPNN